MAVEYKRNKIASLVLVASVVIGGFLAYNGLRRLKEGKCDGLAAKAESIILAAKIVLEALILIIPVESRIFTYTFLATVLAPLLWNGAALFAGLWAMESGAMVFGGVLAYEILLGVAYLRRPSSVLRWITPYTGTDDEAPTHYRAERITSQWRPSGGGRADRRPYRDEEMGSRSRDSSRRPARR